MTRLAYKPIDGEQIDLGQYIPGLRSQIAGRWGKHAIPGQRGALQEDLGEGSLATSVRLQFVGRTQGDYAAVIGAMSRKRRGLLIHPRRGTRKTVITQMSEEIRYTDAGESTFVDISFEDAIAPQADAFTSGPSAQAQQVTGFANAADVTAASWRAKVFSRPNLPARVLADLAVVAVTAATDRARAYSVAAQEAFSLGLYDPAVNADLGALSPLVQEASAALRRAATAGAIQDTVVSLEVMLDAARQLDQAIRANQPVPIQTTITRSPGQSVYAFVQQHYGRAGKTPGEMRDLVTLILRLNRHIRRPSLIPVDTRVIRPAA